MKTDSSTLIANMKRKIKDDYYWNEPSQDITTDLKKVILKI